MCGLAGLYWPRVRYYEFFFYDNLTGQTPTSPLSDRDICCTLPECCANDKGWVTQFFVWLIQQESPSRPAKTRNTLHVLASYVCAGLSVGIMLLAGVKSTHLQIEHTDLILVDWNWLYPIYCVVQIQNVSMILPKRSPGILYRGSYNTILH